MLEIAIEGRVVGTVLRGGSRVTHGVREIGKKKISLYFGKSGSCLCITRHVDEQGISHLKLFPGLDILSHTLR